jgi:hypothetical protein
VKPIIILISIALAVPAFAGLQVGRVARSTIVGGVGTVETSSLTGYQGDMRSELDTVKLSGGLVGLVAGKPKSNHRITRLDRELIWDVFHPDRKYDERPLKTPPDEQPAVKAEASGSGSAPGRYRITKAELTARATGEQRAINGFPCSRYLINFELTLEDTAAKKQLGQVMTTDLWTTPETDQLKQARLTEADFARRFAEKAGIEPTAGGSEALGAGMLVLAYGVDPADAQSRLARVAQEMEKVKGFPIVTEIKWQLAPDSGAAPAPDEPASGTPGLAGGLGKMLGGVAKAAGRPASTGAGDVVFTSYSELRSVALLELPATGFEVPAGYARVKK